jgi:hypothetical protein
MVVTLLQLLLANFTSTTPAFRDLDDDPAPDTPEEIETVMVGAIREKEILGKAITGIFMLVLKWFRASRITLLLSILIGQIY